MVDENRPEYESLRRRIEQEVLQVTIQDVIGSAAAQWWTHVLAGHGTDELRRAWPRELIWCYWHDEGGLVQAMEAVLHRLQALQLLDAAPLRPVAPLFRGFIDDQGRWPSLQRRADAYRREYGLQVVGNAVGRLRPADIRSAFPSAYHNLLHTCVRLYRDYDIALMIDDPRPVLNALCELHLVLPCGVHGQRETLAVQARVEMRIIQELFNLPEFESFLGRPQLASLPADSDWKGRVDTVKRAFGWGGASMTEFWHLARCAEHILLSVRYGPFAADEVTLDVALEWAIAFRDAVIQYIHSYRAVTGVDLSADPVRG